MLRALLARWPRLRPFLPAAVIAAGWPACLAGQGPLVAFLGDSLTSGWRLREEEAYPALLGRALAARGRPVRVVNAGVSGDTAAKALARLPAVLKLRPDLLVVALGVNDGLSREPLVATEAAIERIVLDARAAGARVLLVGVRLATGEAAPRVGDTAGDEERARALSGIFPRVAAAHELPLVPDLLAGVAGQLELLFPDRLHPNAAGHQRLSENVRPQLELLLAEVSAARAAARETR
ncbi:MAG TPA: GDSL-type esterase/lipase family protein [Vicinamibacteria bacterium]|nr:GDSL-type esterase/lipase family protein [Vicinamibacteria bacterium]